MSNILSKDEKQFLDNLATTIRPTVNNPCELKKEVYKNLDKNPISSKWKFLKVYSGLKYLNLI